MSICHAVESELILGAMEEVYESAPHGLCTTRKHQVNEDQLASLRT